MSEYTERNISYEDLVNYFIAQAIEDAGYKISVSTSRLADVVFTTCNNGGDLGEIKQGIKDLLDLLEEQVRNQYLTIEKITPVETSKPHTAYKGILHLWDFEPQTGMYNPPFKPDIETEEEGKSSS